MSLTTREPVVYWYHFIGQSPLFQGHKGVIETFFFWWGNTYTALKYPQLVPNTLHRSNDLFDLILR